MEILRPRAVPLGGLRAMTVRRTLPQRQRTFVGGWCFVDHYGPDELVGTDAGPGMVVPPHPHIGLQTVSWLFSGEIEHRDSAGHHALVRPGEMNLMTAGRGISHSEYSTPATTVLHGAQLWVALPAASRGIEPDFEHYVPPVLTGAGWRARVFLGTLLGAASPVRTHSPLTGAELRLESGTSLTLALDPRQETGFLLDSGSLLVDAEPVSPGELAVLPSGRDEVVLTASADCLLLVLGGEPLGESVVMWWNFVGGGHDEIAAARQEWQALLEDGTPGRFALPEQDPLPPLPAPRLPGVRLIERG